jgi:hypothetical protein
MSSFSSFIEEQISVHEAMIEKLRREGAGQSSEATQEAAETAHLHAIENHNRSIEALRATLAVTPSAQEAPVAPLSSPEFALRRCG